MSWIRRSSNLFVILAFTAWSAVGHAAAPRDPARTHEIPKFTIPEVVPGAGYERFMVIGDWGTGRPDQYKVAEAMAVRAKIEPIDFIITVGDNFYEDGVSSVDDPQWKTKFEDVYNDPALQVPVYPSLGNHDHQGNTRAQVEYSKRNKKWEMPAQYYTFTRTLSDETVVQYFAIDSDPIHRLRGNFVDQLVWLDTELGKSAARWKIVYGHHPLYSNGMHGNSDTMIAQLSSLFVKHKIDVYLCGHDHTLEMFKPIDGVHHVVSGGGAGPERAYDVKWTNESYYAATLGGFTVLRVGRAEIVVEFVRLDGKTEYAHTIRKE